MKNFLILGCGPSASKAIGLEGYITVGVNDAARYHKIDYHVVVDRMIRFSDERQEIISNTLSRCLFTQLPAKNMETRSVDRMYIEMQKKRGWFPDKHLYSFSHHSPFIAAQVAVRLGATCLTFAGVDLISHPNFNRRQLAESRLHLEQMLNYYHGQGIELVNLGNNNILSGICGM